MRQDFFAELAVSASDAIIDVPHAPLGETLNAKPETITSIGMRHWAHVGQPL